MVSRVSTIRAHIKDTTLAAMETLGAEEAAAAAEVIVEASFGVRTETTTVAIEVVAMVGTEGVRTSCSRCSHYIIAVSTSISRNCIRAWVEIGVRALADVQKWML